MGLDISKLFFLEICINILELNNQVLIFGIATFFFHFFS
jgi:hypothetical protein